MHEYFLEKKKIPLNVNVGFLGIWGLFFVPLHFNCSTIDMNYLWGEIALYYKLPRITESLENKDSF